MIPLLDGTFTTMGELKVNDVIIGQDGLATKVLNKFQPLVEDHYEITFDNGEIVKTCGDHLWNIDLRSRWTNKFNCIVNTRNIYEEFQLNSKRSKQAFRKIVIKPSSSLDYPEKQLPIDPLFLVPSPKYNPKI